MNEESLEIYIEYPQKMDPFVGPHQHKWNNPRFYT